MSKFEDIFAGCTFTIVACAQSMLVISIVVVVSQMWLPGFFFISLAIFQIFLVCMAGTWFETACSEYEAKVYAVRWYCLNYSQQKMVKSMLQTAQTPTLVSLLGFVPANLYTFQRVTRDLASYDIKFTTF